MLLTLTHLKKAWGRSLFLLPCCLLLVIATSVSAHAASSAPKHVSTGGSIVTIQADNGLYLSRINYGGATGKNIIEAAKRTVDTASKFTAVRMEDDKVMIQADNGMYLSRINYGGATGKNPIEAAKTASESISQFTVTVLENGKFALKADNGLYLSRINYGGDTGKNPIEAVKSKIDAFSQFTVKFLSQDR